MIADDVREYMALIGRNGGRRSKRALTTEQSKAMLARRREKAKVGALLPTVEELLAPATKSGRAYTEAERAEIERNREAQARRLSAY
jgi:hypothetical protein